MMAIPVFRARVAPVLDWCSKIIIIPKEGSDAASSRQIDVVEENMYKLMRTLRDQGIETLICGALSLEMLNYGESIGLRIMHGIAGEVEEVLQAYREGRLDQPQYRLPGCRGQRRYKGGARCTGKANNEIAGEAGSGGAGAGAARKLSGCPMRKRRREVREDFLSAPNANQELFASSAGKGDNMNKIAITSEGPALDDLVDPRFGRAAGFIIVDLESMETRYIDNGQTQVMGQGAGIQAAQLIAGAGVSCILTGFVGPRAFQALSAAKIRVVQNLEEGMTVRQALERFQRGAVQFADAPNRRPGR